MRFCSNEKADFYEATGDDLPALLRDAADTLDEINEDTGYAWADLSINTNFGNPDYGGGFTLSLTVH